MPAAFAHDLYGRKVYMEADPVIKRIIKKERYCFLLGVHGPDILFFYKALGKNKVNQKGVRMHGEPAAKLMERGRMLVREAETKDERDEMIAYLMGVACHFCLDNRVHAYVNAEEKRTGITHAEIETELERRLLEREHMRPLHSNLTCHLKITAQTVRASSRLFDEDPIDHEFSDHEPAVYQLERAHETVLLLPPAFYGKLWGHSRHVYEETANTGL